MVHIVLLKPRLVRRGLVAEYRFNEKGGQVLIDHSGLGNHGTLGSTTGADTNDPTWTGRGASFTTDDYINCGTMVPGSQLSVFITVAPSSLSTLRGFICKYTSAGNQRSWALLADSADSSKFCVFLSPDGLNTAETFKDYESPASALVQGVCKQIGFVFNTNTLNLYSNGSAVTPTKVTDGTVNSLFNSSANLEIGRYGSTYLDGVVHHAVIYNRALTQAEINQNYNYLKSYLLRERGISLA